MTARETPTADTIAAEFGAPRAEIDLAAVLERRARVSPERPAVTFGGETRTFAQVQERVRRLAHVLRAGGVGPGDRVAYLGLNDPAILETLFAAATLGAILVPLNYRFAGPELAHAISHSGVHTILADEVHTAAIDAIRDQLPDRRFVRAGAGVPVSGWEDGDELIAAAPELDERAAVAPSDPAVIMYTSGTTGRAKGVVLTHANLWWHNIGVILALDIAHDDVSLVCAPMFHIGALNVTTIATWIKGGRLVIHPTFEPQAVLAALVDERVTTMFGVPVMCEAIADLPGFRDADLSALRLIITGGAPVPVGLIRLFRAREIDLAQGYGLTEASPVTCFLTAEHATRKLGSAGRPLLLCDMRIVDPTGHPVGPDVAGEIEVRGPSVTPGYLDDPEATAATFHDGWLRTGDGGHIDADGFVFVSDRVKDMIISGGENIYPAEVEGALFDHPGVAQVAVIGTADDRWGQTVCAVVVAETDATVDLEELRAFAGERIGRYKLPRRLELVDDLPRNATGKVLKTELRRRYP
ncbi:MAG TPA: long-chain fatty acid--CoA ligase [Actinomycetospora sp.]|jgi:fatty-acyl-CoA synthase|uniref:acyl-CoA synthetase n=1 Tax=Actinomycetospora sp. TaxID=1872135 RepID=UPI002F3F2072